MLEGIEIGCIAIAAFIMAFDEALARAPNVVGKLPSWLRFVPAALVTAAFVLWAAAQIFAPSPHGIANVPPSQDNSVHNAQNNIGIIAPGQTGSITQTLQVPPHRHLDDASKEKLLEGIPRARKVDVTAINETEPLDFANEIVTFLHSQGYDVSGPSTGFFSGGGNPRQTTVNLNLADTSKPIEITVGANEPINTP